MKALGENQLKQAEYQRTVYMASPPAGTTVEDMKRPDFWTNTGHIFHPGDRIEVLPEDMAYFVEFIVRDAGRLYANVHVLRAVEFDDEVKPIEAGEYRVQWAGPSHKFRVVRTTDNAVVQTGFANKGAALRFINTIEPRAA
jgi:hypothetical protein